MRKLMTLVLFVAFTAMSFAQKDEIKALEKAIKKLNFADAKSVIVAADNMIGNMDDKTKAKYYFLKAQGLYANGAGTDADIDGAIESLNKLSAVETKMGKFKYRDDADEMKTKMMSSFLTKANDAFNKKQYTLAATRFEKAYKMSPKDTIYLYYAASSAVNDMNYDVALDYYKELKDLGFTGIRMNYIGVNKETGVEEAFPDKNSRDLAVKVGTHSGAYDEKSESKKAEIVKNIALIYVNQDKDELALEAMKEARMQNPEDLGLLLSEANVYLKMGDMNKFKALMEEATQKDPTNGELFYNLGVLSAEGGDTEQAKKYYEKAISLDPNYVDAYNNLAVVILASESDIVEEMNSLGTSAADNKRYDELKEERQKIYLEAVPYLQKALELKSTNLDAARTLMNIYSALGETDKFKAMKAKVEEIESAGN